LLIALGVLFGTPVSASNAPEAPVPVETILAAYDRATHAADVATIESEGTISGEGLTGAFHSWRRGDDERDEEQLGPNAETTLRRGARVWVRNANGNVRELHGVLLRRALTAEFVDSGAFVHHPENARFVGFGEIGGERMWRIEVTADGGSPETLWIGVDDGLPARTEYLDGDGTTAVDLSDWRTVDGQRIAFRSVTSDGDHAFDLTEQTTRVRVAQPIDDDRFAPFTPRTFTSVGVQSVPLLSIGGHIGVTVAVDGRSYVFLLDSGAESVLVDARAAQRMHLDASGAFEVRGAVRTGGLRIAHLPELGIGDTTLDDLIVSTIDLQPSFGGPVIDGILGYPFFASGLVQIDVAHRVLRFGPPGSFAPPGERVALDVDREVPEAIVRLNDAVDTPFIIDSGNSGEVLLYRPFVDAHPGIVPATGAKSMNYGIGGSDATYRTALDALRIGSVSVPHPVVDVVSATNGAFADRVDGGNLGLEVLRHFVVTFDLADDAMYLEPSIPFDDPHHRTATSP
jgi:hypothetical protein